MAGEWIKMRCDLAMDPAVIAIADALGIEEDMVVGKLHKFWSWMSAHNADGYVTNVRIDWVNKFLDQPGFTGAMEAVGWLSITQDGFALPNWERHNSKNAKRRATEALRKQMSRSAPQTVRKPSASNADTYRTECGPEKRREEKRREEPQKSTPVARENHPPLGDAPPSLCLDPTDPQYEDEPVTRWLKAYQRHRPTGGHPLATLPDAKRADALMRIEDLIETQGESKAIDLLGAVFREKPRPVSVIQAVYKCTLKTEKGQDNGARGNGGPQPTGIDYPYQPNPTRA